MPGPQLKLASGLSNKHLDPTDDDASAPGFPQEACFQRIVDHVENITIIQRVSRQWRFVDARRHPGGRRVNKEVAFVTSRLAECVAGKPKFSRKLFSFSSIPR